MKLLRLGDKGQEIPCILDADGKARDVSSVVEDYGPQTLSRGLETRLNSLTLTSLPLVEQSGVRLGSPMQQPGTIFCIGLNYSDHAEEANMPVPEEPILFSKTASAFSGPNDDILYGKTTEKLDWEVELGIVIAQEALHISVEEAPQHIFGYTLVNDVSERNWQLERAGQWIKGKSYPSFCPTGPYLVTQDEIPNPQDLNLWLDVNGKRQQTGSTEFMIFPVFELVSYLSQYTLLQPGDLICTGTPTGVGMGQTPQKWLQIGDEVTLGIDHLGKQCQKVVSA